MTFFTIATIPLVFLVSFLFAGLIVATSKWHGKYSYDALVGVQRFHEKATPRIGGLAIILALAIGVLVLQGESKQLLRILFILGFFVFSFGFTEDITKQVSVAVRLWAGFMPAVIAYFLNGTTLHSIGWAPVDYLLGFPSAAILFTAFAVGGVTQSINIIDGFNGLCSWVTTWSLLAIMAIALQVGDVELAGIIPVVLAAIFGVLLINWPFGKIFLGDGGSYLLGLCVAWCSVLLATRNSSVTPFALFLICIYPITEVLYSMYRRKKHKKSTGQPDRLHLHQLIAMTYVYSGIAKGHSSVMKNSITGFLVSLLSVASGVVAALFYDQPPVILGAIAVFVLAYLLLYRWVLAKSKAFLENNHHNHSGKPKKNGEQKAEINP